MKFLRLGDLWICPSHVTVVREHTKSPQTTKVRLTDGTVEIVRGAPTKIVRQLQAALIAAPAAAGSVADAA